MPSPLLGFEIVWIFISMEPSSICYLFVCVAQVAIDKCNRHQSTTDFFRSLTRLYMWKHLTLHAEQLWCSGQWPVLFLFCFVFYLPRVLKKKSLEQVWLTTYRNCGHVVFQESLHVYHEDHLTRKKITLNLDSMTLCCCHVSIIPRSMMVRWMFQDWVLALTVWRHCFLVISRCVAHTKFYVCAISDVWCAESTVGRLMWPFVLWHCNCERNGTHFCSTLDSWFLGVFKTVDQRETKSEVIIFSREIISMLDMVPVHVPSNLSILVPMMHLGKGKRRG